MRRADVLPYIYDFVSTFFENKDVQEKVKRIILFGSVARDMFDRKSDIDLFIEPKKKDYSTTLNRELKTVIKTFLVRVERTWALKGIALPIKCTVGILTDPTWSALREDIISNGIQIYGKFELMPKGIKHYAMFSYSTKNLSRKNKMRFLRKLFGYTSIKGMKGYKQVGLLDTLGGIKLSANTVLLPLEGAEQFRHFLDSFKIATEIREIWIR